MMTPTAGKNGTNANRIPSTPESDPVDVAQRPRMQFDVQSLLWLTATIGLALMYIRPAGQRTVVAAAIVIAIAALVGLVLGSIRGKTSDIVYWSVLGAAFAFVSTATARLAHWTTPFAWAGVGIVTGCAVASCSGSRWLRCILVGAFSAAVTMGVYAGFLYHFTGRFDWFDLASCVPIGALFALLVMVLRQVHQHSMLRYDATATLLMAAIVAGNYLSRLVAPISVLLVVICCISGCDQPAPTVDPAPFQAAVAKYLDQHDMALRLKKIRQGPTIDGDQATMSASMTHRELGGPSVVWTFQFKRTEADGPWSVVSHSDK